MMQTILILAGWGQLALALGSLWIPKVLGWREETQRLEPLTRGVFWTYAGYIWGAHVAFGLLSVAMPEELLNGTLLSRVVAGFISVWWAVRLGLQWEFRKHGPQGGLFVMAELALTLGFLSCTLIYGWISLGHQS